MHNNHASQIIIDSLYSISFPITYLSYSAVGGRRWQETKYWNYSLAVEHKYVTLHAFRLTQIF